MEKDQLQTALLDWEGEGGSVGMPTTERPPPTAPEPDRPLDSRVRRGSLGPPPAAAPLGHAASGAALQAHLAHLLDMQRVEPAPRLPAPVDLIRLTPHEDIDRQPDGVPHLVIGLTALFSVLLAAVLIGVCLSGPSLGLIAAALLIITAIPVMVTWLNAKAERERDHIHPSR
jgi:hypothetical protein